MQVINYFVFLDYFYVWIGLFFVVDFFLSVSFCIFVVGGLLVDTDEIVCLRIN